MRHKILRAVLIVTLMLSLAAVASAQRPYYGYCANAAVAGTWGYAETGTGIIYDPTGKVLSTVPYASVGRYTIDVQGNLLGTRNASQGGTILAAKITGTATVNPDCTGTLNLSFWDPSNPTKLLGSAVKSVVYVNNATEAYMIVTSTPIPYPPPNGTLSLGAVLTTEAKRVFPDFDEGRQ